MRQITLAVTSQAGLHARPANLFVKTAMEFTSQIKVTKGDKEVDAKRLLSVMSLQAKHGDTVTISAEGVDEDEAIKAFEELFKSNFGE